MAEPYPGQFNHIANVNVVRIPYKGTGPALQAVMTGEVHAMFGSAGGAAPLVKAGRLRALAVGSAQPSPLAPGVPTLISSGLPDFISEALHALYAPAGTPPAIVSRLNQEVTRYLLLPETKDLFLKAGIEVALMSLAQNAEAVGADREAAHEPAQRHWQKRIGDAGDHWVRQVDRAGVAQDVEQRALPAQQAR